MHLFSLFLVLLEASVFGGCGPIGKLERVVGKSNSSTKRNNQLGQDFLSNTNYEDPCSLSRPRPSDIQSSTLPWTFIQQHYPSDYLPGYENLVLTRSYLSSVNRRFKVPNWVSEILTKEMIDKNVGIKFNFRSDSRVGRPWSVDPQVYFNTGYTKGHMAAASNHKSNPVSY